MNSQQPSAIGSRGAIVFVWLLVSVLTSLPYALAHYLPPAGRTFQGFFYFTDDQHLYLSSSQQAEDGAFLFRNKLVTEPHDPALVNLEWWLVGVLSRALGRRPFLAFHLIGVAASLFFFVVAARWLRRGGLPEQQLVPALLLLATGGGFGGLLYATGVFPIDRCFDLSTGMFPFVGLLGNPHFTVGSALFLGCLLSLSDRSLRGQALGVLLGTTLALTRPYGLVLLVALRIGFVALRYPNREWPKCLVSLAGFLPVVAFNYWVFYRNPAFAFYAKTRLDVPETLDVALALLPAALAAASVLRAPSETQSASDVRLHFLLWITLGTLIFITRPVHFFLQFLMGIGFPFLACAALGLSRIAPRGLWLAVVGLGTTPIVAVQLLLQPMPAWYPQSERVEVAVALRPVCRAGDVVFGPEDIGLFVNSFSSCKSYAAHYLQPAIQERREELRRFYGAAAKQERADLLERRCIRVLILPGDDGEQPLDWLPEDTPFRRALSVGAGAQAISAYARPSACGR